jgi:murein DD-endopeptidase MepM/ murein hydrolase activator NlpD
LVGYSGVGSIGSGGAAAVGHQSLSRGGTDRNDVASLLKLRNQALRKNNKLAGDYDVQLAKNLWVLPIAAGQYQLTGRFGDVSGLWRTVHTGLDFACPTGTPIHAIANGTITFVGWDGAYGNKTVETLADGTEIWYAHQNSFGTQVGAIVRQGDVIGYVGATGNTTGPHVHIEVRPGGGDPVDPDPAFREHGVNPDASQ